MDTVNSFKNMITQSLNGIGSEFGGFIPNLLAAIVILIIGWLVTKIVVKLIRKALTLAKADKIDDKINEIELVEGKKLNFNVINIITKFVKWLFYIIIIIVVSDVLGLKIISEEISNILHYLPKLFTALVIFTLGLLLANAIKNGIRSFFESMELSGAKIISQIVFMLLLIFISITALNQAGVNTEIITSNLTMIMAAFLLAFALAFGFGAQKVVGDLLRTFYARKTYEIGQKLEFNGITGEVEAIDNISIVLKTADGKLVVPIKDLVENQVRVKE
ncbi:mechanosensitive ion channel [Ichthyenterobacterium sp. W332]|uniref:Mechanosensitive ion channel n=1 Tax=Microcosmobacter mediterraneus TaxID=3075607 RepID=A0ABU2YKQ8_9FLAO|nr:mechanosensitive ion channel domain-containing protein [Ichthyenterobacterium sp. W332]MDT0558755.1 mechanosensitive ion channel [Ichthyenterobacterium sp. W332]